MDTVMTLTAYGESAEESVKEIEKEINHLSVLLSAHDAGGEIFALNQSGSAALSEETRDLILRAKTISEETDGAFSSAIFALEEAWGFYSGNYHVLNKEERESLLPQAKSEEIIVSEDSVTLENGAKIDLGGIAKGYASDQIRKIAEKNGVSSAIFSLGGNIVIVGKKIDGTLYKVGIQDPNDASNIIAAISAEDTCVITSGAYQRFFEKNGKKYHHILDPSTGAPAESGLLSVTVISEDGVLADALSTAFFVMGMERSLEWMQTHQAVDVIFITETNQVYYSKDISLEEKSEDYYFHKIP